MRTAADYRRYLKAERSRREEAERRVEEVTRDRDRLLDELGRGPPK